MVYSALISFDFPLDESLELVEKYKVEDAVGYLKYKLGRTKDARLDFEKVTLESCQLIESSIQKCLGSKQHTNSALAEAEFSYEMCVRICEEVCRDDLVEAKANFMELMKSLVNTYLQLINRFKDHDLEQKLRVFEVKNFVFSQMIEDLIVVIAKNCGTVELMEVAYCP